MRRRARGGGRGGGRRCRPTPLVATLLPLLLSVRCHAVLGPVRACRGKRVAHKTKAVLAGLPLLSRHESVAHAVLPRVRKIDQRGVTGAAAELHVVVVLQGSGAGGLAVHASVQASEARKSLPWGRHDEALVVIATALRLPSALPLDTAAAALSSVMTFSSSPAGDGGGVDRSTNAAPSGTLLGIPMSAREWDGGHISYYNFDPIDKIRPFLLLS